jgi:hypothetical protein
MNSTGFSIKSLGGEVIIAISKARIIEIKIAKKRTSVSKKHYFEIRYHFYEVAMHGDFPVKSNLDSFLYFQGFHDEIHTPQRTNRST